MIPDVTCPCIIMRHGGLDGVALQKEEYFGLLQKLEIGMHVVSGRQERAYTEEESRGRAFTIVERMHDWALEVISANEPGEPYNGGPYRLDNLSHIVLNPTQRANFVLKYDVPSEQVYEIPDFLEFPSKEPQVAAAPEEGFLDEIAAQAVVPDGDGFRYETADVDERTVFFLSPVRPVYRKRLIEAMLTAHAFAASCRARVAWPGGGGGGTPRAARGGLSVNGAWI